MAFSAEETAACKRLVELALEEDLGSSAAGWSGDLTTRVVITPDRDVEAQAVLVARAAGVLAGLPAAELAFATVNTPLIRFEPLLEDGARISPGDRLGVVRGVWSFILTAERTALNFLQHLSGVATLTRRYVDQVAELPCRICDTRKTLPGWRLLQKYAVRCGGGENHRLGLYDAILVKDNHLALLGGGKEGFRSLFESLTLQRQKVPSVPVEIEVDSLEQLEWALACLPDVVLLDNMTPERLREAVRLRNELSFKKTLLEASGGVTLETVRAIAETGVDRISVGALTHSAPALDIALDYEE
jgi:nicotinate-nucleotide pyrophosphorylase (carboxylating)